MRNFVNNDYKNFKLDTLCFEDFNKIDKMAKQLH